MEAIPTLVHVIFQARRLSASCPARFRTTHDCIYNTVEAADAAVASQHGMFPTSQYFETRVTMTRLIHRRVGPAPKLENV